MIFGDSREELAEYGSCQAGKGLDHTSFFPDFHNAEPEGQDSCQAEGYLESRLCRGKRGIDDLGEHFRVSADDQFAKCHHEGYQKEGNPDVI